MTGPRFDIDLDGEVEARIAFTDRWEGGSGGSSRTPFDRANLASHVGDDAAAVRANRELLATALGVAGSGMCFMHPSHGRDVAVIGGASRGGRSGARGWAGPSGTAPGDEVVGVDALVGTEEGIALVALGADCVPILMLDPAARVFSATHCGWRGLALDVAGAALATMSDLGARAQRTTAWLGPAICGRCYAVPTERAQLVGSTCAAAVTEASNGQPGLDIRQGLTDRLTGAGVRVVAVGGCTAEDGRYFSHRREGVTGRQAGAIALRRIDRAVTAPLRGVG